MHRLSLCCCAIAWFALAAPGTALANDLPPAQATDTPATDAPATDAPKTDAAPATEAAKTDAAPKTDEAQKPTVDYSDVEPASRVDSYSSGEMISTSGSTRSVAEEF